MTKRVLIVEDRPDDAAHLARELERRDMVCSCVRTFAEAMGCVSAQYFDCVLLDANLPDSEARDTVACVHRFGDIPVIFITGDEDPELIRSITDSGAGLELKPVNLSSLVPTMLKRMNRRAPSVETSQEVIREHHRAVAEKADKTPWLLRWQPILGLSLALVLASFTGGAFLYRSIGEKATQTQENLAHFLAVDSALKIHEGELKAVHVSITNLDSLAQTSVQDRAQIHRDIEAESRAAEKANTELKKDIIDRLNRIEDKLDRERK